jgi:hypothetical protein
MAQLPRQTRRLRPVVEDVAEVARRRRTVAHRGCNPTQLVGSDSSVTSGSTCHSPWHTTRAPFLGRRTNRAHNTSGSSAGTYKGSYGAVRICPERWYRGATSRFGAAVCHARIGHDYRYPGAQGRPTGGRPRSRRVVPSKPEVVLSTTVGWLKQRPYRLTGRRRGCAANLGHVVGASRHEGCTPNAPFA